MPGDSTASDPGLCCVPCYIIIWPLSGAVDSQCMLIPFHVDAKHKWLNQYPLHLSVCGHNVSWEAAALHPQMGVPSTKGWCSSTDGCAISKWLMFIHRWVCHRQKVDVHPQMGVPSAKGRCSSTKGCAINRRSMAHLLSQWNWWFLFLNKKIFNSLWSMNYMELVNNSSIS